MVFHKHKWKKSGPVKTSTVNEVEHTIAGNHLETVRYFEESNSYNLNCDCGDMKFVVEPLMVTQKRFIRKGEKELK